MIFFFGTENLFCVRRFFTLFALVRTSGVKFHHVHYTDSQLQKENQMAAQQKYQM